MLDNSVAWPNQAKCAVMITVNLDAELFWLNLSPDSIRRPKTLSMGQYGIKRGLERVLNAFDAYGVRATFFIPGKIAELYPEAVREIANRGHEIAHHGYAHEHYAALPIAQQREEFQKGIKALETVGRASPRGFRAPEGEITIETLGLLKEFGFAYSSSMHGSDLPYFIALDGKETDIVEIPAQWELNDFPYFAFNYTPAFPAGQGRPANYSHAVSAWKGEYRGYYKYGLCYVTQFDPQTIGTPGRIALMEDLLGYITKLGGAWFCTGSEMAEFWRQNGK